MSADDEPQFVDTNVLVYAHDASAGEKARRARELLDGLWESGAGCLSVQVLQEFFAASTRQVRRVLDPATASAIVGDFARWNVHAPRAADVIGAIEIHRRSRVPFWDAMILRSALQLGCRTVWSEDLNAGQDYGGVRVRNPFA